MADWVGVGRVLGGRYQPERLLGGGGMGAVWAGRDLRLDRPVAIKVLVGDGLSDPTAMERFEREARIVARLTHPNVVAIHDFGAEDGAPYLVMELVEGETVAAMLRRGPLAVDQAVAIAAQTCDGLAAAHAAGIVHRDVKPANLILTTAGVVKICDFGIARLQDAAGVSRLTGPAIAMGSSSYMAPEQINDEPVDARTDLYGLGCTIYAMLAGDPPFTGDTPLAVAHLHLSQVAAPVRSRRPEVPPALAALVDRLLAKAADDRPADAPGVRAELAALMPEAAAIGPTADLRLASVPRAAAPTGATAESVPAPAAPPPRPVGAQVPAGRSGGRWPARTWRIAALISAAVLTVIAIPLLGIAGCLPAAVWHQPSNAAGPSSAASGPWRTPSAAPEPLLRPSPSSRPPAQPTGTARSTAGPTTSGRPSAPSPVIDPIVAMRLSIQRQLAAGNLAPATATALHKKVDELAAKINDGETKEATKKSAQLREELGKLVKDGRLTPAGYDVLVRNLDRIDRSIPVRP